MQRRIIALSDTGYAVGEGHHNAKLTNADVDSVFELREAGLSLSQIGLKFGVGKACIFKILHGRTRAETPVAWRTGVSTPGTARTRLRSKPASAEAQNDSGGALLQRALNAAWR